MIVLYVHVLLLGFATSVYSMENEHYFSFSLRNCTYDRVRVKIMGSCTKSKNRTTLVIKTLEPDQLMTERIFTQDLLIRFYILNKGTYVTWDENYDKKNEESTNIYGFIDY